MQGQRCMQFLSAHGERRAGVRTAEPVEFLHLWRLYVPAKAREELPGPAAQDMQPGAAVVALAMFTCIYRHAALGRCLCSQC